MLRVNQLAGGGARVFNASVSPVLWLDDMQAGVTDAPQPSANRGTVSGGSKLSIINSAGKFGSKYMALACDGADTTNLGIALPGANDWRSQIGTGALTFSLWVQKGASYSNPGDWRLFRFNDANTLEVRSSGDCFTLGIAGTDYQSAVQTWDASAWWHLGIVRSEGVASAWFSGARVINQVPCATDFASGLANIYIGSSSGVPRGAINLDDWVLCAGALWDVTEPTIAVPTALMGA